MSYRVRNIQRYITIPSNLEIDEFQLVLVINSRLDDKILISNTLNLIRTSFMVLHANLSNQNIENVGLIIGRLYLNNANGEFTEPIFNPIKFFQNMNMGREGM
jgi:hypothetical protein